MVVGDLKEKICHSGSLAKRKYYLVYSGLFLLLSFLCFGIYMLIYNKSILRFWDMYNQHYICFIKMGQWIRSIIREGKVVIWDPAVGYGSDFFLTLSGSNSGSLFDPINWLSALVPARFAEYGFTFTVFLRLYLCGISFSVLAFSKKYENYSVLCGAITYTFCACAYVGLYQFSFIVPMYVFPLLIVGINMLFERDKPFLYTVVLALSALWSYYFTFMMAILTVIYCIIKWFCQEKKDKETRKLIGLFGKFVLYSLLAAGMAAVVLLPIAKVLAGMGRLDLKRFVPILYDEEYYHNMAKGIIGTFDMGGKDCKIGYCLIAFISIVGLFVTERTFQKQLKIEIVLMSMALCMPIIGHIMNGFSYVANRWIWAYALSIGCAVTVMLPKFHEMARFRLMRISAMCAIYVGVLLVLCKAGESQQYISLTGVLIGICVLLFFIPKLEMRHYQRLMLLLTCATIVMQAYYFYSNRYTNYFVNSLDAGTAYEKVMNRGGLPLLKKVNTNDGTRYCSYRLNEDCNAGWLYNVSGINFYYSCFSEEIDQFHKSVALKTNPSAHQYMGLDNRSELMALLGVNHYFVSNDCYLPIGYDVLEADGIGYEEKNIQSWTPVRAYSLFSRFTQAISKKVYLNYTPLYRQEILMKACVLEDGSVSEKPIDIADELVNYELKNVSKDIELNGETIIVKNAGAQMDLVFADQSNAELYVFFGQVYYEKKLATSFNISVYGMNNDCYIDSMGNGFSGYTYISHLYGGKHDWLLNLGTIPESVNRVRVCFSTEGTYTLQDIRVYKRNIDDIVNNIQSLNHQVEQISFPTNEVKCKLTNSHEEYLFIAIPFSEGWKAYDNGNPIDIHKADVGFMALKLQSGEHDIHLIYRTPGIGIGLGLSLSSIIWFIIILLLRGKYNSILMKWRDMDV